MINSNILLTSSLFYFRIPRENWEKRMKLLKTAGYNAIDVYFPWNYHETAPGVWDFTGNRDVEAFLKLAAEHELYVIARPGPYICSEWDGGAIPAWLTADGVAVRQDDPEFLKKIGTWYEHILPRLAPYQIENGGSIIAMQIENELDFFDCKSPVSYMEKLMKRAKELGIHVPLFYCCGQNDLLRAGGLTPGLYTAFNVYSDAASGELETRVLHLYRSVSERNMPLLITETNREHSYLKRLLACGAKLISPYNQTAGNTTEWHNSITNWGINKTPIALMATDYDFDSMIGSAGEVNEEIYESRLLSGLLHSFIEDFVSAVPKEAEDIQITSKQPVNTVVPKLCTKRGEFLGISNLGEADCVVVEYQGEALSLNMEALETKLLAFDLELSKESRLKLLCSNYEVGYVANEHGKIKAALYGKGDCYTVLEKNDERKIIKKEGALIEKGIQIYEDNDITILIGLKEDIALTSIPKLPDMRCPVTEQMEELPVSQIQIADYVEPEINWIETQLQYLEKLRQYRGIGCYEVEIEEAGEYLLQDVADILTITREGIVNDVIYGRGNSIINYMEPGKYRFYVEIWGHSNFDDIRCKSLRMSSLKGIKKAVQLTYQKDISDNWLFDLDEQPIGEWSFFRHSNYNTIMGIDSYIKAVSPLRAIYDKWVDVPKECDSLYLHFSQADCMIYVYINGHYEGIVLKDDPYVDISQYTDCDRIEVCLRTERKYHSEQVGKVLLIGGKKIDKCLYGKVPVEEVKMPEKVDKVSLPFHMKDQKNYLMTLPITPKEDKEIKLFFKGQDVKLTIIWDKKAIGRLVLENEKFPEVKGGRGDVAYLNSMWLNQEQPVIWCQTIGENPRIDEIRICYYDSVILDTNCREKE